MSRISYLATEAGPPELGSLGERHRRGVLPPATALALVHVPLVISVGVNGLFFLAYWLPEISLFWGHEALLGQLAPLASKELTSQSTPLVAAQGDRSGLAPAYLLLAALALPVLARSRTWLARLALWPVSWLALICSLVVLLGLAVRGELGSSLLGVLLLAVWMVAAVTTSWRSLWVDVDRLPRRPDRVGWLLGTYALLGLLPVAVGRQLFAPELRQAAAEVQDGSFALRWTALITPASVPLYLAGVLVGLLLTLAYRLVPPALTARTRRIGVVLLAAAVCLVLAGAVGAVAGARRAEQLRTDSPAATMAFRCGSWVDHPAGRTAESVIASGATCRRVTGYLGFRQTGTRELYGSLSPIRATTPEGREVSTEVVAGRYGPTLVVATTSRLDNRPDELVGMRVGDLAELWRFRCPDDEDFRMRFAGADGGDDPAAGRLTGPREGAGVVVGCKLGQLRLDPETGRLA